jgi:hypothetical protein
MHVQCSAFWTGDAWRSTGVWVDGLHSAVKRRSIRPQGTGGHDTLMRTVFDIANTRYEEWVFFAIPLALLALAAIGRWRSKTQRWSKVLLVFAALTFLIMLIPLWDYHAMKGVMADGRDIKVAEGVVNDAWTQERREARSRGDIGYRYRTWEGFTVGGVTFGYWRGFQPSGASFTNRGDPPVAIENGMRARITYHEQWDDKRILKLELGPAAATSSPGAVASFASDWTRFATAAATGDAATVKALTRFPFLFEGQELSADRFDSIWMGLFTPAVRECMGRAQPQPEEDRFVVFCTPYVFYFDKGAEGWRFSEFTADPEG